MTPTDRVYQSALTADGYAFRVGDDTRVRVNAGLPYWARTAAIRELLRVVRSTEDPCASATLPPGAALTLPAQRAPRHIIRSRR